MKSKNLNNSYYTWIILLFVIVMVIVFTILLNNKNPIIRAEHMTPTIYKNQVENFYNRFDSKMKVYNIKFKTDIKYLQSEKFHPLSSNGPFFDAHFGSLTSKTPIGQTYYIRPLSEYTPPCIDNIKSEYSCDSKNEGVIIFYLNECFPSIHANKNRVSKDFRINGSVKIYPFEWENGLAKVFNNQTIEVNLILKNNTGLEMKGFHIHDGVNKNGLTGFGPISYFLYTTEDWIKNFNYSQNSVNYIKKYLPLPPDNIIQKEPDYLLKQSKKSIL